MEKKFKRLILSVAHDASRINLKRGSAKRNKTPKQKKGIKDAINYSMS